MPEKVIARVTSLSTPMKGQKWRSSDDFGTTSVPESTIHLRWDIAPNSNSYYNEIYFDVAEDHKGSDKTAFTNIHTGTQTPVDKYDKLYIGNPRNAGNSSFDIIVVAVYTDE
ncbi:DeoR family transcriptional regulator [Polyangium sp. 15x6]|uniref:DeoR family transcriptional regulator n=1 Tax=Polyangium sp. 15x6 TaxID=3042687 RepID=UPI002499D711|nr:DeoR family transcriptional regulator [Polyangium sp. 15x6]MDI3284062.1 DeoR family transcriptional regulator [Polyangium sp. 15x6]